MSMGQNRELVVVLQTLDEAEGPGQDCIAAPGTLSAC